MRIFLFIWSGQVVSMLGSAFTSFALGVWVYQRSGSATRFTLLVFVSALATVLALPVAGALVDRWDRRRVLLLSNAVTAAATAALAALDWSGRLATWHAYAFALVIASFSALQMPAFMAEAPLLVPSEQLGRTAGLTQLGMAVPGVLGPLLGGGLVAAVALRGILLIDLASYAAAVLPLAVVRLPRPPRSADPAAARSSLAQDVARGWTWLRERPGLMALLATFAGVNFCLGILRALLPPMILALGSPAALGSVMAVAGCGMVVGGIVMAVWGGPRRRVRGVFGFLCVAASTLLLAGAGQSPPLIAAAAFVFTFCFAIINGCNAVIWQTKIPAEILGRALAVLRVIALGSLPLASLVAGPLADRVFEPLLAARGPLAGSLGRLIGVGPGRGIALLFIVLGAAIYLVLARGWSNPRLRHLEDELPDAAAAATALAGDETMPAAEATMPAGEAVPGPRLGLRRAAGAGDAT
jgi:MFS transporter, DHA3 family, macrolide efflux protein